jgi:4-hydroxybenzoate polyprenyltransferase
MQDVKVDRRDGLHSLPSQFGIPAALIVARACHALTIILLAAVGLVTGLGWPYWIGVLVAGALFIYEHRLVSPTDLSKLNMAFSNVNGYISITLFAAALLALLIA